MSGLRKSLPKTWVLREYKPDYGLDFSLETFRVRRGDDGVERLETFGEHLFIQLKSTESAQAKPYEIYGRYNVEKGPEVLNKEDPGGSMDTVRFALDTPELVTVQRMGASVPVLLVIADLAASACYFVCLNDYIDKILIPRHGDYSSADTRTVHVPILNRVNADPVGPVALRWYAKRAKLYAAFAKFHFQHVELQYAFGTEEFERLAGYFAQIIRRYDFWDDTEMWGLINHYGRAVERYAETGRPGLMRDVEDHVRRTSRGDYRADVEVRENLRLQEVLGLWQGLSVLPRQHEEVCREWFLPTALALAMSYPYAAQPG